MIKGTKGRDQKLIDELLQENSELHKENAILISNNEDLNKRILWLTNYFTRTLEHLNAFERLVDKKPNDNKPYLYHVLKSNRINPDYVISFLERMLKANMPKKKGIDGVLEKVFSSFERKEINRFLQELKKGE